VTFKKASLIAAIFVFVCGAAYGADTVGLVNSEKIMFQHPEFNDASRIILYFSRALEGTPAQILSSEKDPERRQLLMKFATQVAEFADMDRAIAAENDIEKKSGLWEKRQIRLSEFEAGLMRPILEDCMKAMQAVMTNNKMTVLIELDSVYYGGTDITEDVIKQLKRSVIR
jgi:outer membrane protein